MPARPPLLALVGPTASGKTAAAVEIAERLGAEIVSVDSMSVYRGMNVGTAKPSPGERARVRHHLIDVADPGEEFSVARYQGLGRAALGEIGARGHAALAVGGTGLYYRALVDELEFPATDPATRRALEDEANRGGPDALYRRLEQIDPLAATRIEPTNVRRTVRALEVAAVTGRPFSAFADAWDRYPVGGVRAAGVTMFADVLRDRIERRIRAQYAGGLLEEVGALLDRGMGPSFTARQAIGYAEATRYLEGSITLEDAIAGTIRRTKALARRQMAWFRRDPRIRWFEAGEGGAIELVQEITRYMRDG